MLVHHTHPDIPWYASIQDRDQFAAQIRGTVHFRFPWPFGQIFLNIMEHTAHHVDTTIPSYRLAGAQRDIEREFDGDVEVVTFSLRAIEEIFETCCLYDFEHGRWLDFDGCVTAVPGRPDFGRRASSAEPRSGQGAEDAREAEDLLGP